MIIGATCIASENQIEPAILTRFMPWKTLCLLASLIAGCVAIERESCRLKLLEYMREEWTAFIAESATLWTSLSRRVSSKFRLQTQKLHDVEHLLVLHYLSKRSTVQFLACKILSVTARSNLKTYSLNFPKTHVDS